MNLKNSNKICYIFLFLFLINIAYASQCSSELCPINISLIITNNSVVNSFSSMSIKQIDNICNFDINTDIIYLYSNESKTITIKNNDFDIFKPKFIINTNDLFEANIINESKNTISYTQNVNYTIKLLSTNQQEKKEITTTIEVTGEGCSNTKQIVLIVNQKKPITISDIKSIITNSIVNTNIRNFMFISLGITLCGMGLIINNKKIKRRGIVSILLISSVILITYLILKFFKIL